MDGYLGDIRMMPYGYTPQGWQPCDGRLLAIASNPGLFAVISNTYGGDGRTTFGLPNLQSLVPVGLGAATSAGPTWTLNAKNHVEETVVLSYNTTPDHTHAVTAKNIPPANWPTDMKAKPANNAYLSRGIKLKPTGGTYENIPLYNATVASAGILPPQTIGAACGNGQNPVLGHENRQPYLAMGFFICVEGEFPVVS